MMEASSHCFHCIALVEIGLHAIKERRTGWAEVRTLSLRAFSQDFPSLFGITPPHERTADLLGKWVLPGWHPHHCCYMEPQKYTNTGTLCTYISATTARNSQLKTVSCRVDNQLPFVAAQCQNFWPQTRPSVSSFCLPPFRLSLRQSICPF